VAAILQQGPGVMILATSRERLKLQGEWGLAVEGLPYPEVETPVPGPVEGYSAVQLFLQSARRADSAFTLGGEEQEVVGDVGDVVRVCKLVGGLPLAIEMAAAWTPMLSVGAIADEIASSLDFLDSHQRDTPQRHR